MDTITKELEAEISIVNRMIYGNWMTQVTYVFAELGVTDVLSAGPKSINELAGIFAINKNYLKRFLRCASDLGFLSYDNTTCLYYISERGKLLGSDHPFSKREEARLNGAEYRYQPWGNLIEILKHGMSKEYSPTFENGTLDYLKDKPELLKTFHKAMSCISVRENSSIIKEYDFSKFSHVMDIGSGEGSFIKSILNKEPHLIGYMFDLKETFGKYFDNKYDGRLIQKYGDFFNEIPDCADLYTMKNVIHNWPESKVINLLENTRDAMLSQKNIKTHPSLKRVLIIENLSPENGEASIANWMDLNFLILIDGAERTLSEYLILAARCGLSLQNFIKTSSGRHILEFSLS